VRGGGLREEEGLASQAFAEARAPRRPLALTLLCLVGAALALLSAVIALTTRRVWEGGPLGWAQFLVLTGATAFGLRGVWRLERKGAWLLLGATAADALLVVWRGEWHPFHTVWPSLVAVLLALGWRALR
jgi:hypothetical protein